jgi:hypothetical protein
MKTSRTISSAARSMSSAARSMSSAARSIVLSVVAAMPVSAFATQTLQYSCSAINFNENAKTGFIYDFEATASLGSEGTPIVRPGSTLSVTKFYGTLNSDNAKLEPLVTNEVLRFDGTGASWIAYNLGSSVFGLSLNFYPDAVNDSGADTGYLMVFHTVSPDNTLVSDHGTTKCSVTGF